MGKRYNEDEDQFLKNNFSKKGLTWCSNELNRTSYSIKNRAKILKLKVNRMGLNRIFDDIEIDFIKNNYSIMGSEEISKKLNKTKEQIFGKAMRLGLLLNDNTISDIQRIHTQTYWENHNSKSYDSYNINPDKFMIIDNPEISYILGFLWADGYIINEGKGYGKSNYIDLTILENDMNDIKWIFDKIGNWNSYYRKRDNKKPQISLRTQNRPVVDFLIDNDYDKKSLVSADKILEKIPNNLKNYFLLGFFDGDGCIYIGKNCYLINFTGSYNQNWKWLEDILKSMNIKYSLTLKSSNCGKSSVIRINKIKDIEKIYNYMYNYDLDKIGLYRKYIKINTLLNDKIK